MEQFLLRGFNAWYGNAIIGTFPYPYFIRHLSDCFFECRNPIEAQRWMYPSTPQSAFRLD
jgi:hypothetical protein